MPLYAFKVIEKMLTHHEQEQQPKPSKRVFPSPKEQDNTSRGSNDKKGGQRYDKSSGGKSYTRDKEKTYEKKEPDSTRAYGLFSNSAESFLVMHMNEKKYVFLEGISHPDKYHPLAKQANNLINEHIKRANIFLDIKQTLENGDVVAEVFLDQQRTRSLNQLLIQEGLDKSQKAEPMKSVEPETDMKEEKQSVSHAQTKPKQKNSFEHAIGYLLNHGYAPYQHQAGASKSYFIDIEVNGEKQTRWGVDFARAIRASKVNNGDYIEIKKSDVVASNGSKRVSWNIIKKEGINDLYKKNDGPPVGIEQNIQHSEEVLDKASHIVFEAPDDWSLESQINWEAQEPVALFGDIIDDVSLELSEDINQDDIEHQNHNASHDNEYAKNSNLSEGVPIHQPVINPRLAIEESSPFDDYIPIDEQAGAIGMDDMPEPPPDDYYFYEAPEDYSSYGYDEQADGAELAESIKVVKKSHRI